MDAVVLGGHEVLFAEREPLPPPVRKWRMETDAWANPRHGRRLENLQNSPIQWPRKEFEGSAHVALLKCNLCAIVEETPLSVKEEAAHIASRFYRDSGDLRHLSWRGGIVRGEAYAAAALLVALWRQRVRRTKTLRILTFLKLPVQELKAAVLTLAGKDALAVLFWSCSTE